MRKYPVICKCVWRKISHTDWLETIEMQQELKEPLVRTNITTE